MLVTMDLFPLQILSPSCLNITCCPASHHFWPKQTDNQIGFKPQHRTAEMIIIRFASWISGRIVSVQPDTDIQKLLSNGNRIRIRISANAFIDVSRIQTFGNHSFIIFRSIFSAFCASIPSLSMV